MARVGLGEGGGRSGGGGVYGIAGEDMGDGAAPLVYDILGMTIAMSSPTTPFGLGRRRSDGGGGVVLNHA